VVLEENDPEVLEGAGEFAEKPGILGHVAPYLEPQCGPKKIQRQRPVAIPQQLFDQDRIAEEQVVHQMVVKRLVNRQFPQRALEKRDCHIGVSALQRLSAKINLLLQDAVKVSTQGRHINHLVGSQNGLRFGF
jgi:hypothetical protein